MTRGLTKGAACAQVTEELSVPGPLICPLRNLHWALGLSWNCSGASALVGLAFWRGSGQ